MLSSTLSSGTRLSSWFTRAIPYDCASWGFRSEISWPSKRMTPSSGLTSPTSAFTSVLLPAPLWPQTACTSPSRTSIESPRTARTGPKDFDRSTTSSTTRGAGASTGSERDPDVGAGSRSPFNRVELKRSLEGAELRELRDVRPRDALLLDVGDLRGRLAVQDLRPHLDRECRLDLRRLRAGAVLDAGLDRVDADGEAVAAGDDETLLRDTDRDAGLLRALDDADRHVVGHAV